MVDTFNPSQDDDNWQGLTITCSAAKQINHLIANNKTLQGMRLGVKKSGCAGFAYDLAFAVAGESYDYFYETDGAKVFVPQDAMPYVDGTVVDYVSEGVNKLFKFDNPRATDACGCGESFSAVRKQ
jgi:Fe-S cluster assembly protein SufA